jgi:hypothetical protein
VEALPERLEIIIDDYPKHCQTIQCQTDTDVVTNADVEVPRIGTKISFIEFPDCLQNHGNDSQDWLYLNVFYG